MCKCVFCKSENVLKIKTYNDKKICYTIEQYDIGRVIYSFGNSHFIENEILKTFSNNDEVSICKSCKTILNGISSKYDFSLELVLKIAKINSLNKEIEGNIYTDIYLDYFEKCIIDGTECDIKLIKSSDIKIIRHLSKKEIDFFISLLMQIKLNNEIRKNKLR